MSDIPLCVAAYEGRVNVVIDAVDGQHFPICIKDSAGRNLLHWAASGGRLELVRLLAQRGMDINENDGENWSPLMIAVSAGHTEVAKFLVDSNCNVNSVNSTGQTAMHYAASKNRLEILSTLLSPNTHVDHRDSAGTTPLHRAISKGHMAFAEILLTMHLTNEQTEHECDPKRLPKPASANTCDDQGQTPLHYACEECNIPAIQLLLKHGGDVNIRDKSDQTALDLAPAQLRPKIEKLARRIGA